MNQSCQSARNYSMTKTGASATLNILMQAKIEFGKGHEILRELLPNTLG